MKIALIACVAATLLLASGAAAQVPNVQLPEAAIQPRALPEAALQARRIQILRTAGVPVPPAGLREVTTLSVNAQSLPNARLQFYGLSSYLPGVSSIFGSAAFRANAVATDAVSINIAFRGDARTRYIVDCMVSGPARSFQFERLTGGLRDPREISTVTVSEGRVSTLVPPPAATGEQRLLLKGLDNSYYFHQCEIVPVR